MTVLIGILGSSVARLNSVLCSLNWENVVEIDGAIEDLHREATKHSPQHLAVMRYLTGLVRDYQSLGEGNTLGDRPLLEFKTTPKPLVFDDSAYDVFICYKIARHATQAAWLHSALTDLGYRVWFDKEVLDKMQDRPERFEKEHLISILTNAIRHSRCTVVFEAAMHAVVLPPGSTEEQTLANRSTMKGPKELLVAWDWQILEIGATEHGVAIHSRTVTAFQTKRGETIWSRDFYYDNDEQLLESIKIALALIDSRL